MTYEVIVEPTGDIVEVAEGQTLLDAALRQGVWLPFACGHGTCGTCKIQVLEGYADVGDASTFALMDSERADGVMLACCCKPESDMVIEADIDVDPDFLGLPVEDYHTEVLMIEDLSPTIKKIRLKLDRPMGFQAGQYINLHFPHMDGTRAFSIATPPSEKNEIELHIRKVPGGVGTTWLHEELSEGDALSISGPYGQFFVRKSDTQDVIFIAGGSGLSSPESMILDLLEDENESRQIYLFYGARNKAELYHYDKFIEMEQHYPNFHYLPALDNPDQEDHWSGFVGYVHELVSTHFNGQCSGHKAYLCGPPLMIDAAITMLMQSRLFERDIHMEQFITAADSASGKVRSALFKRI